MTIIEVMKLTNETCPVCAWYAARAKGIETDTKVPIPIADYVAVGAKMCTKHTAVFSLVDTTGSVVSTAVVG
jgi:hypothetical protein